ncbi:2,3,4,5-tetrahydropyridine-2,6-dicarboxylate N-succinyltransferase [Salinarimonas soli]|uniref:2,3,4,5-tetrahydropyridine-2,6-dicarboxylate N-succinyltransferase n=1 Tax=Salinarimonas soli TaxID=1638099 RepID=A0A5B2V514_9HYPH|nr:2,3,4,5-tetrahydropyridine-2,6-dicarboxylate N-succinyltransferase [Salinarimonas soli]KAA2234613.1 2,3,4,5-tetrahydropyridine-2,6-dicarboxylate N-succinyltransferase [Salinarimonas soli]
MHVSRAPVRISHIAQIIEDAFGDLGALQAGHQGPLAEAVHEALAGLDAGTLRAAEKIDGEWQVNRWLINALMVAAHIGEYELVEGGPGGSYWWDKEPPKFRNWGEAEFRAAGFRALPHAVVRHSAFIGRNVVLMPCFVSWGARVDEGTMIDSWATVGSCAQIGRNVHVSAGATIGGVIEPAQVRPVIIEDECFIGARCSVVEGVIVGEGSVLAAGTALSGSTKIVDRTTGEIHQGEVPPYSVVVPGSLPSGPMPDGSPGPFLHCAVIIKRVDARTREKARVNDLFRV